MNKEYQNFSCRICMEVAQSPVVTPCGHMYCWDCLYKWANVKNPLKCPYCMCPIELDKCTTIYAGDQSKKTEAPKRPEYQRPQAPPPPPQQNGGVNYSFGIGFPFMFMSMNMDGNNSQFQIIGFIMMLFMTLLQLDVGLMHPNLIFGILLSLGFNGLLHVIKRIRE